jgi:hypothetical protein
MEGFDLIKFDKDLDFFGNIEYFLYVVLNEVYMTNEEIVEKIQYLEQFSDTSMTADDLIEYFNKRLNS